MKLEKYQTNGNCFLITTSSNVLTKNIPNLLDDKLGIGSDGLIYYDLESKMMHYYNKDGSKADFCGNGSLALALFLKRNKLVNSSLFLINTLSKKVLIEDNNDYFKADFAGYEIDDKLVGKKINLNNQTYEVSLVKLGVKHLVILMDDLNNINEVLAKKIIKKLKLTNINLNFMKIIDKNTIEVITYENGVGFTLSCGSGNSACSLIAHKIYHLKNKLEVINKLGRASVVIKDNIYYQSKTNYIGEIIIDD